MGGAPGFFALEYSFITIYKMPIWTLLLATGMGLGAQVPLTVAVAIRKAWADQAGLRAGQAMVESRQAEAEGFRDLRLPTLTLRAQGVRTNEPMQAFGIKLNQARIGAADFNPLSLNHPNPIGAYGAGALQVPARGR